MSTQILFAIKFLLYVSDSTESKPLKLCSDAVRSTPAKLLYLQSDAAFVERTWGFALMMCLSFLEERKRCENMALRVRVSKTIK